MIPEVVHILGAKVHRVSLNDSVELIEKFISDKKKHQVCVPNVYTTVLMQRDEEFKEIHNSSSLAIPDGMPLVWVSRLYGKPIPVRVSGTELFLESAKIASQKGYKFFILGGSPGIPEKIKKKLNEKYQTLKIIGTYSPPFVREFSEEETHRMISMINNVKPDVLWVGMTAPKQEKWIGKHLDKLQVHVAVGVGMAFDILAGEKKRAPKLIQNVGLEWLYRLCKEPKRLWKRYLIGNTVFIWLVIKEFLRVRILEK